MGRERKQGIRIGGWLLVAAVTLTAACQGDAVEPPEGVPPEFEQLESNVVFGMVAFMSANGVREGRIEPETAYTFPDSALVRLHGMIAVFYDENGAGRATVTGREGEWDQETNRMASYGDVVLLVHTDGSRIESAELHYDPDSDRVWSDSATVQTSAEGSVLSGTAFESDIEFTDVRLMNPRGGGGQIRF
jgi:LPS export ABC transporter protein LptC